MVLQLVETGGQCRGADSATYLLVGEGSLVRRDQNLHDEGAWAVLKVIYRGTWACKG